MALKCASLWVCARNPCSNLGASDCGSRNSGSALISFKLDLEKFRKWECCRFGTLTQQAITPVEDEKPHVPGVESSGAIERIRGNEPRGFHKDLNLLPKPLTANDLSSSPSDGSKVRVAYQGLPGAYSEAAALKAYPKCETVPCDQFEEVFKAVELWLVDKAVLPIENSVGGSIHRNYDLLLRHRLHIVGEVQLQVNHCLLGLPGTRKEEIKSVLSHPMALAQCDMMLCDLGVLRISAYDTAGAAQMVASTGLRETGAIASAKAAEIYGLDILAEKIQDDDDNITRFLILAREPIIPGTDRPYKTSIVFTLEEGPGVLFKALSVFALRSINLSKIESRPWKQHPLSVVDNSNEGSANFNGRASRPICFGTPAGIRKISSCPWQLSDRYSSIEAGHCSEFDLDGQTCKQKLDLVLLYIDMILQKPVLEEVLLGLWPSLCMEGNFHSTILFYLQMFIPKLQVFVIFCSF